MSMGPPQAEEALREALGMGADRAILLSDRVFAVADTLGTSRTLALALRKEGFDLVLCGRKTVDSETWQVPPEVAAFLGVPHLTNVTVDRRGPRRRARRTRERRSTSCRCRAVVSIAHALTDTAPQAGSVETWTASDLVDDVQEDDKRFGQTGSPTRVLAVRDVTPERARPVPFRRRRGARCDRGAAGGAPAPESLLGQARPHRREAGGPVRLVDAGRARQRPADPPLARAARAEPRAGGQARRPQRRACPRPRARRGDPRARPAWCRGRRAGGRRAARLVPAGCLGAAAAARSSTRAAARAPRSRPARSGRDLGPRVAGDLELGMTGDCVARGHRQGRPPAADEARVRGEHRLGDHGRDDTRSSRPCARGCTSRSSRATTREAEIRAFSRRTARRPQERRSWRSAATTRRASTSMRPTSIVFAGPRANLSELDGVQRRRLASGHPRAATDRALRPAGRAARPDRRRPRRHAGGARRVRQGRRRRVVGPQPRDWADIAFDGDWRDLV